MQQLQNAHPIRLCEWLWPDIQLYNKQREILMSLWENDETVVPAGNMLGKDFVGALGVLLFFLTREPCRIVTTSATDKQLRKVLWGEIHNFIESAKYALPLLPNQLELRKVIDGKVCPKSYVVGIVSTGEGMLGHHLARGPGGIPTTMILFDESSGIQQRAYEMADTWAHRKLAIGNPFYCRNFFYDGVKSGDLLDEEDESRYYRKVLKIKAQDSPNVRYAEAEIAKGLKPSYKLLLPGVIDYKTYKKRRSMFNKALQCTSLDAEFWEEAGALLFPPEWLNVSEARAVELEGLWRQAEAMGVDTAQGGDNTAFAIVDKMGLMELISMKTPDTSKIVGQTIHLIHRFKLAPEKVLFDLGGGGKQHADTLSSKGYNVQTVAFGGSASPAVQAIPNLSVKQKVSEQEERYAYKNRRAEMYGLLSQAIEPHRQPDGTVSKPFAIPARYYELRRQLSPIPRQYDSEGRLRMIPKNKNTNNSSEVTLYDLLGCSPDEADALVLAYFGTIFQPQLLTVGAL